MHYSASSNAHEFLRLERSGQNLNRVIILLKLQRRYDIS